MTNIEISILKYLESIDKYDKYKVKYYIWYINAYSLFTKHPFEISFFNYHNFPSSDKVRNYINYPDYPWVYSDLNSYHKILIDFVVWHYSKQSEASIKMMFNNEFSTQKYSFLEEINTLDIIYSYRNNNFTKNFVDQDLPGCDRYYVLKTNQWYSFTMDMSKDEAEKYASYNEPFEDVKERWTSIKPIDIDSIISHITLSKSCL